MAETDEPLRFTVYPAPKGSGNPFGSTLGTANGIDLDPRSRDMVIRTIFGEADGTDEQGRAAVAHVIRNRVASGRKELYGEGPLGVITKPYAFEPWSRADATARMRALKPDDPNYQAIAQVVDSVFSGRSADPTQGATHFYSPTGQAALSKQDNRKLVPDWARGKPLANIGGHLFYAPEGPVRGTPSSSAPGGGGAAAPPVAAPSSDEDATALSLMSEDASKPQPVMLAALADNKAAATPPAITPGNPFGKAPAVPFSTTGTVPKAPLPPELQTKDIGQGTAFGEGVKQGVTFNFWDELQGLGAALATLPADPGNLVGNAVKIARNAWGDYNRNPNDVTMAAYERARDEARDLYKKAKEQYPWTTFGGEAAGGAVVPLPGGPLTSTGKTLGTRVLGGIAQGATAGGLAGTGAAEGGIKDRIVPGMIGTGVGGLIGAGTTTVFPAISNYIGSAILDAARPGVRAIRRLGNLAIDAGRTAPQGRVMPGQATADTMVADLLGEPGRGASRAVHNMSDVASSIIKDATEVRASGQYGRLVNWLESKFGPMGDNEMARLRLNADKAQTTTPLYQNVMDQYKSGVMPQRLIDLIDQHPTLKGAAEEALRQVQERAAVQQRPTPNVDSLEFWDQVKKNIQGKISWTGAQPGGAATGDQAALKELQRVVINELDNATGGPKGAYATARETSKGFFDIDNAITEGQRFVKSNQFTTPQAENAMKGMSQDAQDAFKKAALSQMLDKMGGTKDSHNLWKNINSSPDAQAKLKFLFNNDQKAITEFEAMQHVENLHERLREAVRGNSTTVKQYLTAAALGGTGLPIGYLTGNMSLDPTTGSGAAAWSGAALGARRFANQRMAEHLATMLVSKDPALLQQAAKFAGGDVRMMNLLRTMTENVFAKTGGAAAGRSIGD